MVDAGEACDDGNSIGNDCCSSSCQVEATCEVEPNDTEAEGNELTTIVAGGSLLRGHINPTDDVDYFRFEVPAGSTGSFAAETIAGLSGLSCGMPDFDPAFMLYDGMGDLVATNDDIDAESGNYCASITTEGLAEGEYFLAITRSPYAGPVTFGYVADTTLLFATCGNSTVEGNELCDDGNTTDGDGCSATCSLETATTEVEPNNTFTQAQTNPHITPNALITGAITPIGDVDYFAIDLPGIADLAIETFDPGSTSACASVDTQITLFRPNGTTAIATDDDSGILACSKLDPTINAGLSRLAAGTYYLRVREFQNDATIPGYNVVVRLAALCGDGVRQLSEECDGGPGCNADCTRTPVCGDGIVNGGEMCDDGNTTDGDGCSATCALEGLVSEVEPNDTTAEATTNGATLPDVIFTGAIDPAGDEDYYAIEVPSVADLVVETFDGNGPGSCEGVDTELQLIAPDGTTLLAYSDEEGINSCSLIEGPGAIQLPPGTYFVRVNEYFGDPIDAYSLQVRFAALCGDGQVEGTEECDGGAACDTFCQRVPTCGDGHIDAPETCDDGNTTAGDGCSATCVLEATAEEEPNDTATDADTNGPIALGGLTSGSISPESDLDVFAVTLTTVSDLRVETFGPTGPGACDATDTFVEVLGTDGATVLAEDDDGGISTCSLLNASGNAALAHLPPGTYYVRVQSYNQEYLIPGYTLQVTLEASCGDGQVEGTEECDGGAGCTATCERVAACGDGYVDFPEGCDDGNTTAGDGCSATCTIEGLVAEVEPNDSPAEADLASVQITGDAQITGAIGSIGDQDVFVVDLPTERVVRFEVLDSTAGDCQGGIETTLRVLDDQGTVIATDEVATDDMASGISGCSALVVRLPAGTHYVQVEDRGNNAPIPFYLLEVRTQTAAPGETESNNTIATADVLSGTDVVLLGEHPTYQDSDFFAIQVGAGQSVRAEILEGTGDSCESGEVDSRITLFDADGVQLADDDDDGRGLCSTLDGTGSAPRDGGAHGLDAGTYYLRVRASAFASTSAESFSYRLALTVR